MTNIAWTDVTWNPTAGCSLASPGCTNCYAMRDAHRMAAHPNTAVAAKYAGTTRLCANGRPVWTGRINLAEHVLLEPLGWRKPRRVFVNSMSDIFHHNVPIHMIDRIWAVMALAERHSFQILTKRPERMRNWLNTPATKVRIEIEMRKILPDSTLAGWPLKNVWLGTSVEDQERANERIPVLLDCPAVIRFISAEPLLGQVTLAEAVSDIALLGSGLDWVIVGGESGHHARPMHTDWARSLRDECDAAGVSFFFKQVGSWSPVPAPGAPHIGLMPDGERVAPWQPGALELWNVGAAAAGHLLDGQVRQSFPYPRMGRVKTWLDGLGDAA